MAGQKSTTPTPPTFEDCELLTLEEFAEKMKVCLNTVREWINKGVLVEGQHFVKICSVTRFPYPEVLKILCNSALEEKSPRKPGPHVALSPPKHRSAIDLNY